MQLDLRTLLIVLLTLYACLGFVCLFLPYRMRGSHAVTNWGWGMLVFAAGSGGIALRGVVPDFISVVFANMLILGAFLFIQRSASQGLDPASNMFGLAVVGVSTLLVAYFTYMPPDIRARIIITSVAMAVLIFRPALALMRRSPGQAGAQDCSRRLA